MSKSPRGTQTSSILLVSDSRTTGGGTFVSEEFLPTSSSTFTVSESQVVLFSRFSLDEETAV